MNWYVISNDEWPDERRHAFAQMPSACLVNKKGEEVTNWDSSGPHLTHFDLGTGHDIRDYDELFYRFDGTLRRGIGDFLHYGRGWSLMFSSSFVELVKESDCQIDPDTIITPIHLVNSRFKQIWPESYYLFWPRRTWNATDENWSKLEFMIHHRTKERVVDKILRWLLLEDAIPECDMFAEQHLRGWLVSERLKDTIENSKLRGLDFTHSDLYTQSMESFQLELGAGDEVRNQILSEVAALKAARAEGNLNLMPSNTDEPIPIEIVEERKQQSETEYAELTDRRCPECGALCPSYRKTCKACNHSIGRAS